MNNEDLEKLIVDCANFIQPYVEGGCKAEQLVERLYEAMLNFKDKRK